MVTLAALELQHYLQKISRARLPIVTSPSNTQSVKIYIGESEGTKKLGVTAEGLKYGAFRIVTGADSIVLIGQDKDYVPRKPFPAKRKDRERAAAEWDEQVKDKTVGWGFPLASEFKGYWNPGNLAEIFNSRYGADGLAFWQGDNPQLEGFWQRDNCGSLNATYEFLRRLGVSWYMPGDLGEVVPELASVTFPATNETVTPDFRLRDWMYYGYKGFSFDGVIYARRLGMTDSHGQLGGPHGGVPITSHPAMQKAHPERYALIGGKRDTEHRGHGTPCFSSEGFVQESVNYVRYMYDTYDLQLVDIWPTDGLRGCGCDECKGKSPSDLVWGYVDKVAREVYKTHPDRFVSCGAYTTYRDVPDSIKKFSPNVVVQISNCVRAAMEDPKHWSVYQNLVNQWAEKIQPGNIMRLENARGFIRDAGNVEAITFPVIHPRAIAKDLNFLKDRSFGDAGEQSQAKLQWSCPGLNHINLYVQSRFLWDANSDLDAILDDYFERFYGSAAAAMKEAFTYAEDNLARKNDNRRPGKPDVGSAPAEVAIGFRDRVDKARSKVGNDVYGQRIDKILSELVPREAIIARDREEKAMLAKALANAPLAKGVKGSDLSAASIYKLQPNDRKQEPGPETSFRIGWEKNALLLDIICKEPEMADLVSSPQVYEGDYVAVSLATPDHSYYHIEINPDGAVVEGRPGPGWKSLSDIKTERGPDFWRVQIRIPVVGFDEAQADPNHRVAGSEPTAQSPWFFNVGRSRPLPGGGQNLQGFSPTGRTWHVPAKFGRLEIQ